MAKLADALSEHLLGLGVETTELLYTERAPSFRGSSVSAAASEVTASARRRHLDEGYGFWEHVVAEAAGLDTATRQALFAGAIRHNAVPERSERLSVTQLRQRLLRGNWEGLSGRRLVSLSSRVWTEKGALRHLVMMDFGIPASGARSKEAVAAAQEVLGLHGLLVLSGNSYHLYGDRLVEWPDLVQVLARCSLLSPVIDARWVAHQIVDGRAALRLSTSLERQEISPVPAGPVE